MARKSKADKLKDIEKKQKQLLEQKEALLSQIYQTVGKTLYVELGLETEEEVKELVNEINQYREQHNKADFTNEPADDFK